MTRKESKMTESRRLTHLVEKVELLKRIKANTRLSNFDLLSSHCFLRTWVGAYGLHRVITSVSSLSVLGPLWDFLREHDVEVHSQRLREELLHDYLHSRCHH